MQLTVEELAKALGAKAVGALDLVITGPSEPQDADETQLALAMNPSYAEALAKGNAKVAVLWDEADWQELGLEAAIFVPRPRYALAGVNRIFKIEPEIQAEIHPTAIIDPSAKIGPNAAIGPFVVIGCDVQIGKDARIFSHSSIAENVKIGDNVLLCSGVRIGARVEIGDDFIAQPNAAIGNDGFAFVTPQAGAIEDARSLSTTTGVDISSEFARINSLGTVIIGNNVEIGANSAIDRGTISNTVLGNGTKIDNLVMIGHNAKIGENCLMVGQAGVAGSVKMGNGVILAGQVGVADNITIGDNVVATGQSGLTSNVPANRVMMGTPAVKMETSVASYQALRRLPRLVKKIEELQKLVSKLDANE